MSTAISRSDAETFKIAKDFAAILRPGDIVTLTGDLGAGKTTFTKGLAQGLGITKKIISPTFTIMNVLPADKNGITTLVHVDTYRLKDTAELEQVGITDYLGAADTVCVIEWPDLAEKLLNKKIISITITHGDTPTERKITIL